MAMPTALISRPHKWSLKTVLSGTNNSPCRTFFMKSFEGSSALYQQCCRLPGPGFLSLTRATKPEQQRIQQNLVPLASHCKERLHVKDQASCGQAISRRAALALPLLTIFKNSQHCNTALAADEKLEFPLILESYVDEKDGFTLLKPTQWSKIEKAGATVLFEDPQSKGNNVGVVVNPVRISSLRDFGTVDIVANKLLQAEKRKPSTNDVQLIKVNERQAHGGTPLYQLEYKLDSSRGIKRILSAVTVASKKLYILNVAYADTLEKPLQPDTASLLEKILDSFDVLQ